MQATTNETVKIVGISGSLRRGSFSTALLKILAEKALPAIEIQENRPTGPKLVLAFVVLWLYGNHMVGLILGVILLDCGVQAGHVSNQTRIYGLLPEARSRLNMVYMICYFTAGAIGSYTGTLSWKHFGWNGVCALGGLMILLGAAVHTFARPLTCACSRKSQFLERGKNCGLC